MKPFLLHELEHNWSGFLIDLDVRDSVSLFKSSRLTRYGVDPETVHEAWEQCRTIVTANESDFVRDMLAHSKRDSGRTCQDGWGLLIVPSEKIVRDRLIPKVKNGVKVNGNLIRWPSIGYANLCISLHTDGSTGVRRFRRCVHCQRHLPITDKWYLGLPEIVPRKTVRDSQPAGRHP
jgi:hypothetical protein